MRAMFRGFTCFLLASAALAASAGQPVEVARTDGAQVPLMVYEPASLRGCPPLALLSPGAGGNERGLSYLADALSADGWRAIVIGHRESGMAALKQDVRSAHGLHAGLVKLVDDPAAYRGRFMDIDAARAWAQARCRAPFTALLGHSMGAHTAQLEAGARNNAGLKPSGGFDAYVALSPSGSDALFPPGADDGIRAPILMITGTRDSGLGGDYHWRSAAFDALPAGHCDQLAVIAGASHMQLAGAGFARKTEAAVTPLVTAWLDGLRAGRCVALPDSRGVTVTGK